MNRKILLIALAFSVIVVIALGFFFFRECPKQMSDVKVVATEPVKEDSLLPEALPDNTYLLMATLYQQQSAEYRALCLQAFRSAREALLQDLADKSIDKPRAIITDIDETVLDNSPFQAACILNNTDYPIGWDEWCMMANAEAVPGALEFFRLANGYGIDVFYVTNRKEHLKEATLRNLVALGFPDADTEHVMMRTKTSDKEPRRSKIEERFHIALFIGDNLADFSNDFYHNEGDARRDAVDKTAINFGKRWIVLPNPMYGDWESAFYKGYDKLDDTTRLLIMHDMLVAPERL